MTTLGSKSSIGIWKQATFCWMKRWTQGSETLELLGFLVVISLMLTQTKLVVHCKSSPSLAVLCLTVKPKRKKEKLHIHILFLLKKYSLFYNNKDILYHLTCLAWDTRNLKSKKVLLFLSIKHLFLLVLCENSHFIEKYIYKV